MPRKLENQMIRIQIQAYKESLKLLVAEAKRVLPHGWSLHLAVGWGLTLMNEKGETVFGYYKDPPKRLPAGVRGLLEAAATMTDALGCGNETITRKGLKKWTKNP